MIGKQHVFLSIYHYLIVPWSLSSSYSCCVASLWPYLPLFPFPFVSTPPKPNLCSGAWTSEGDGDQQQQWRRHPLLAQQYCQCWARTHQPCNSMAGGEPLDQGHYSLQSEYFLYQSAGPKPPGHQRHFPRWWEHNLNIYCCPFIVSTQAPVVPESCWAGYLMWYETRQTVIL